MEQVTSAILSTPTVDPVDPADAWERHKLEYERALAEYQNCSALRRQDLLFAAAVQGAVLTVVGNDILRLDSNKLFLSFVAFCVLLTGLNSQRRLAAYMRGYSHRAAQIEAQYSLQLLAMGRDALKRTGALVSSSDAIPVVYGVFLLVWLVAWTSSVVQWFA